jgi:UMF1 family MFS transporter
VSTFVPTALLFLLFSLPLFLFCHDRSDGIRARRLGWRSAFRDVGRTLRDARRRAGVMPFILASFLYQDAMGTIVAFMALYAVKAMGFARGSETTFFLVLTVPAIVGSAAAGHLVDRFGSLRVLTGTIVAWIVLLVAMICAPGQAAFWGVGLLIGLIFGGVPTAERTLLLSLVPEAEASRYFSLMLLSSRAAAIVGPLAWSVTVDVLEPIEGTAIAYRAAVGTVALMFVASLLLLRLVPRATSALPMPGMAPSEPVLVTSS